MKSKQIIFLLLIAATLFSCKEKIAYEHISNIPPLKDSFAGKFMMGNVFNPYDLSAEEVDNPALTRHYNALTAENEMKPSSIAPTKGFYRYTTADRMVDCARASGFQVIGHTLLWHNQIPSWQKSMATASKETAIEEMKQYITDVVSHFSGKIYSWDVLNEGFPDGNYTSDWKTSMRAENPWFKAIGSDFVYEGFLAARLADPNAILYYNDYNTDLADKATMIRDMVRDVNERYKTAYPNETRLLIEGIGMQEHHNAAIKASAVKRALKLFKPLGVKIAVSELDVLIVTYKDFEPYGQGANRQEKITGNKRTKGLKKQTELYGEYFKVYLEYSDIIERVTFWGVSDNKSWRSAGLPLLFDPDGNAKDAYYRVIKLLRKQHFSPQRKE
jgi:endo-1,4-beta-xylanase